MPRGSGGGDGHGAREGGGVEPERGVQPRRQAAGYGAGSGMRPWREGGSEVAERERCRGGSEARGKSWAEVRGGERRRGGWERRRVSPLGRSSKVGRRPRRPVEAVPHGGPRPAAPLVRAACPVLSTAACRAGRRSSA